MKFKEAISEQEARTQNNMKARKTTASAAVDLFYKIGASRGKDIIPQFQSAFIENKDYALRIAQWARDVRNGAGERQLYRDILLFLDVNYPDEAISMLRKTALVGRWDDLLLDFKNSSVKNEAFTLIKNALDQNDGLCAKWMPRKGKKAIELRNFLNLSPKAYRKLLVRNTEVVETKMCDNDWDTIDFSHVPSQASKIYVKAFYRHTPMYAAYLAKLKEEASLPDDQKTVKVNAKAIYPYQVLEPFFEFSLETEEKIARKQLASAQWDALPNYIKSDSKILAMVDVSGSMFTNTKPSAYAVAVSLGLYCADKNTGDFKDTFLTFSGKPELLHLKGSIGEKIRQMSDSTWGFNTNLHAAFDCVLDTAIKGQVSQEDMPAIILIMSDMQFDQCIKYDDSAIEMINRKYNEAGYKVPKVVFWNLNSKDNVPVRYNDKNVATVSGFSPAILEAVLADDLADFTPEKVMLKTILNKRYDY